MNCPRCSRIMRRDEYLETIQHLDGICQSCPVCIAEATGTPVPPEKTYPKGSRIPRKRNSDGDMEICALCRRALYWNDQPTPMRVPENDQGVEPGVYASCYECVRTWKPAIMDRLLAEGAIAQPLELASLGGNMLL
jgi:hypothetical protein